MNRFSKQRSAWSFVTFLPAWAALLPIFRIKSIRIQRLSSTTSRNSSVLIRLTSLSSHGMIRELSTEYIHLTANSIALRQLIIDADTSIGSIFSAEIATSAKLSNFSSVFKKSKLVMRHHLTKNQKLNPLLPYV